MSVLSPNTVSGTEEELRWQLVEIVAHMEKPVVGFGDGLGLDGPLQWSAYQMHEDKDRLPDPDHEWCVDFDIPVARWEHAPDGNTQPMDEINDRALSAEGNLWGWCISNAQADWEFHDKTHVRKKECSDQIKDFGSKNRVNIRSGQYKSGNKPYPIKYAEKISWVALCDPGEVLEYLKKITHIGKLTNHGWGKIQSNQYGNPEWSVLGIGDGHKSDEWWMYGDDIIARIPYGYHGIAEPPQLMSMRAPRWDHRRHAMMIGGKNELE